MMKGKKEITWFLGTTVFSLLVLYLFFNEDTYHVNVNDTYLIIDRFAIFIFLLLSFFFIIYFIIALVEKFKIKVVNLVLIVATSLMILVCTQLIALIRVFNWNIKDREHPPLSVNNQDLPWNAFDAIEITIFAIEFLFVIVLIFKAFKLGKNKKKKPA